MWKYIWYSVIILWNGIIFFFYLFYYKYKLRGTMIDQTNIWNHLTGFNDILSMSLGWSSLSDMIVVISISDI